MFSLVSSYSELRDVFENSISIKIIAQIFVSVASVRAAALQAVALSYLRTFALIVSAHPYCARNSRRPVIPRHALSARAVEEM